MTELMTGSLFIDELKQIYRQKMEMAAREDSSQLLGNRFPWQTRIAVEQLLKKAAETNQDVCLLSGSAPEGFFNEQIIGLLNKCLASGCRIKIVAWSETEDVIAPALKTWARENRLKNVELRFSGTKKLEDRIPHFLLVGDKAYRQESPHASFQDVSFTESTPQIPARICFNDPETGASLKSLFEDAWGVSSEVAA